MKGATWTHTFVCLAKKSQACLPSLQERYELSCAGLGEKKISIEIEGNGFDSLYDLLLEQFLLLMNAGGIELMRTGFGSNSKTLNVIPVLAGRSSYTIAYLKEILKQAKCYVRPIQRDLPKQIRIEDNVDTEIGEVRLLYLNNIHVLIHIKGKLFLHCHIKTCKYAFTVPLL